MLFNRAFLCVDTKECIRTYYVRQRWIPAFAGMTEFRSVATNSRLLLSVRSSTIVVYFQSVIVLSSS